jgi:hypothetical protein
VSGRYAGEKGAARLFALRRAICAARLDADATIHAKARRVAREREFSSTPGRRVAQNDALVRELRAAMHH